MRRTTRKTLSATIVASRYRLQREMARGGMGTVWLADDSKLGREVAVKVMSRDFAEMPEATSRFEREARAAAQLRSAHVVEVYDYGIQEGLPFIVMEKLDGENLGQRLKRFGRLPLNDVAGLVQQICLGLKSAHGAGLVHRDLKPSNIFLALRDGVEVVKLLDFGVVKATDIDGMTAEEATLSGMLLGTPQYMSPEQARATRELDQRSDLWSVGVILFRLLTGHNPFKGESVGDVVLKICSDALPKITDINPELPQSLNPFFERAFAREPEGRFQTAQELSAAFVAIAAGTSVPPIGAPVPFGQSPRQLSSSGTNQSRPSFPGAAPHLPGQIAPAGHTSGIITPVSGMTGPRPALGSIPGTGEATPISTTVGGTQLASLWPKPARPLTGQPVALVVAGAATLITFALVAAIWLGSSPSTETGPTASPAARADIDLTSNDDDDPSAASTAEETTAPDIDEGAGGSDESGEGGAASDESDPQDSDGPDEPEPSKTDKPKPTPTPGTTPAQPRPKSGTDRPDWGLSGK